MTTASLDELRSALRESLQARGVLGEVRARLRAEIFNAIDAGADTPYPKAKDAPAETVVVAALFRDFLRFSGYSQTLSVFEAEAGISADLPREAVAMDLGVADDVESSSLPLVYGLVEAVRRHKRDEIGAL